jgi:hypothetical protein
MPPHNVPNYYYLSKQDMERFGVLNVQTPVHYRETDVSGLDSDIIYIALD